MIFESISPQLVAQSIARLREQADRKRVATYQRNEAFYLGGDATKKYLWRHEGEGPEAWAERRRRFTDCGLTGRIGNAIIAALYGKSVDRILADAGDTANQELQDVLYNNHWESKQRIVAQGQVVNGDGWVSVRWSDRLNDLKLHVVDTSNMLVELDPDDQMREVAQVEIVIDPEGSRKPRYWVWTVDRYGLFEEGGKPLLEDAEINGWRENPYGLLPYIHWRGLPLSGEYWGLSPLRGVVEVHEHYNNRASQLDRLIVFQAHSLLAISGLIDETIKLSADNALLLPQGADAKYLAPMAELAQVRESLNDIWQRGFDIGAVPMSIIRGGSANSGFQLVQEYRTMNELIEDLKVEARSAEEQFVRVICALGSKHGLPLPEDPEGIEIDFNAQVIPADKDAEFQRDLMQLQGTPQTMTRKEFLLRWSGRPVETIDEYIAELEAEEAKRRTFNLPPLPEIEEGSVL